MVKPFEELPGIIKVTSGYTGGTLENPSYEEVCTKATGHYEAVQITFDAELVPYKTLLEIYWRQIDPTNPKGQFFDQGQSYQTAIFYHNQDQQRQAQDPSRSSRKAVDLMILSSQKFCLLLEFYPAEEYHQGYHRKDPAKYIRYRQGSGRDAFLEEHWSKDKDEELLRSRLTQLQYEVTQEGGNRTTL